LVAAGVCLALCRAPGLRVHEPQRPLSPRAVAARVVAVSLVSSLALIAGLRAVTLLSEQIVLPGPWAWLARPEAIAGMGLLLLISLSDTESDRVHLLLGSSLAAGAAWAGAWYLEALAMALPLSLPASALAAAILAALMLSPGKTARRLARAHREVSGAEPVHLLLADANGGLLHADDAARQLLALPPCPRWGFRARERLPVVLEGLVAGEKRTPLRIRTASGHVFEAQYVKGARGASRTGAVVLRNVTNVYRDKRRLFRLAHHDSLTGLANRRLFLERLKKLVLQNVVTGRAALFCIDLDDFKATNDSLGHAVGDTLLSELAERFRTHLRPEETARFGVDPEQGPFVARLGGDEFAVIAPGLRDGEAASEFARHILDLIGRPIDLPDRTLNPSASIGIALFPSHGQDIETLLQHADSALYLAKARGRQRFALYEASIGEKADRARAIEEGLRTALERREMRIHYQPKVDVHTHELVGLEALMRWKSPLLGDVGPSEFIPVAEDQRSLIASLGSWCLDETCRQIRAWQDAGFEAVPVAVNVSSAQFTESDLQATVCDALNRHRIEPRHLELELTESLLLDERSQPEQVLRDLRCFGVRLALDDFGTGYSALTYLNRFTLDILKMDRDLLREIDADPSARGIAAAVVSMAHSLGLHVVAEGVDAPEQLPLLRKMNCDQIQGFLFAPALPADDVVRFMHRSGESPIRLKPLIAGPIEQTGAEPEEALPQAVAGAVPEFEPFTPSPSSLGRVLVVDDESRTLAAVVMRLVNLGFDTHYAPAVDEGLLLVAQEKDAIRLLVCSPTIDLAQAEYLRKSLVQTVGGSRGWVMIGERPEEARQRAIRESGVDGVLWAPFSDAEVRYVVKSAMALRDELAERRELRVPVDLVAKFQTGDRREMAVISTLSPGGAFLEMGEPFEKGESLRIEIDLGGDVVRTFARVVHVQAPDPERPGEPSGVGVVFYGLDRNEERLLRKAVGERQLRYQP
jgi:diguanylate cyclase (GGDEF)-like protein